MRRATAAILLALPSTLGLELSTASANEWTDIATAFEEGNPFDVRVGIDYTFEARRAAIKREQTGTQPSGTPADTIPIAKDLLFSQNRHVLTPHLEIGLFHDLQLSLALPITVSLSRQYEFDQSAEPCVFPGKGEPTCIDRTNSSTVGLDKLLPDGSAGQLGYDADDPTTNFGLDSKTVFRSIGRSGIDQLVLGLSWAPMNQAKDDTKPTWILSAQFNLSIGKLMKFDRTNPGSETGVSTGVHEFHAQTSVSKRVSWAEPFVVLWWQTPIAVRGDKPGDANGSLFWDAGFGQRSTMPQQQAGTTFGFDATLYEKPEENQKITLELLGKINAHFNGQGYSEMWEIFAYAGDAKNNPSGPLVIDPNPTSVGDPAISHPGVTTIENYLTFAGRLGVNAQIGSHARFSLAFELGRDQTHAISFTDAGVDFPACGAAHGPPDCETTDDLVVTPGTREVNPLHKQVIDVAGRRYLVDSTTTYSFLATGELLF